MILFEQKDSVAIITLNRPNAYNAFIREMALELQNILEKCNADDSIRCIVITGSVKALCEEKYIKENR